MNALLNTKASCHAETMEHLVKLLLNNYILTYAICDSFLFTEYKRVRETYDVSSA